LLGNFIFAILSLAMILLWPRNIMIVWLVSIGFGLSLSSAFPTLMALSETRLKVTGRVTSLFFVGASLGGLLMPMLLGQIFDYIGSYYIMVALFITTCLAMLVLLLVLLVSEKVGEKQRNYPEQ
jgi:FHS family Na+ dependent glucose MFS transporter 1